MEKNGYKVTHVNLENYKDATIKSLFNYLFRVIKNNWDVTLESESFSDLQNDIEKINDRKCVLIIDEIEGLNPALYGQFLHTIRNLYHSREAHCLKSVVLVGVSNIVGIVEDNASLVGLGEERLALPTHQKQAFVCFNIADNMAVPYFTDEETKELLAMHEAETGQCFDEKVKDKITRITANQPGLVNAFAYQLVERYKDKNIIGYDDYLPVEHWFLYEAIDKNIANVISKAKHYRPFVERLLFTDKKIPFDIERKAIKFLHTQGIIRKDEDGNVTFWVPIYRKKLYNAFYPHLNGESNQLLREINLGGYFLKDGEIDFDHLVASYKTYVKRRSFRYFREKDDEGNYKHIKEAAMIYSFEAFIQTLLSTINGKSYREAHAGLGNSDLLINVNGKETLIEFKIYRDSIRFESGKKQLAHYCRSASIKEGIYLVFVPDYYKELKLVEAKETIEDVQINTYLVWYDEEKDF